MATPILRQRVKPAILWCAFWGLLVPSGWGESPPQPPAARSRKEVQSVLAQAPRNKASTPVRPLTILLLADVKDHGKNEHDYPLWQERWARLLGGSKEWGGGPAAMYDQPVAGLPEASGAEGVKVITVNQWPSADQFAAADLIVAFCYLKWNPGRLEQFKEYLARGKGVVLIHSATWTMPKASAEVKEVAGVGGFQFYRHGPIRLRIDAADHPICKGLPRQIELTDESYWPPTPDPDPTAFTVLASSEERIKPDAEPAQAQMMFWTYTRGAGRVFGCVPGHYTWTFDDPYLRILLLRGFAWAAGQDVYRFDPLVLQGARVE